MAELVHELRQSVSGVSAKCLSKSAECMTVLNAFDRNYIAPILVQPKNSVGYVKGLTFDWNFATKHLS